MTIHEIQQIVCADYGVTVLDLVSRRRQRAIIAPRHVAIWLARHCTVASLPDIGRAFGGRDHTTVLHAIARIDARIGSDETFVVRLAKLRRAVDSVERIAA